MNDIHIVKWLLIFHADPNISVDGVFPLTIALQNQNLDIARLLLDNNTNPNFGTCRRDVLSYDQSIELLLEYQLDVNHYIDLSPITILYYFVSIGNQKITKLLLEKGASPNLGLYRPLSSASFHGNLELVILLVENGALIDEYDQENSSPLYLACKGKQLKPLSTQINQPRYMDVIEYLLIKGADHSKHSAVSNWTPLHSAVLNDDIELVKLLIQYGADATIPTVKTLETPLDMAHKYGLTDIVDFLSKNLALTTPIISPSRLKIRLQNWALNKPLLMNFFDTLNK